MSPQWHLAQVNVSTMRDTIDSPLLQGFVAALDPVNATADNAPGFVWRLMTEEGDATAIRAFDDPLILVNMSVWESIEALEAFAYGDRGHRAVMRGRREWFHPHAEASFALWWLAAGEVPSVEEASARLAHLREHGPTQAAFTFRERFAVPHGVTANLAVQ